MVGLEDQDTSDRLRVALAEASAEIEQLKEMIRVLREELEAQEEEHQVALQGQKWSEADERRQLQATIRALREELEASGIAHAASEQEAARLHQDEVRHLQATIRVLRDRLERTDGD